MTLPDVRICRWIQHAQAPLFEVSFSFERKLRRITVTVSVLAWSCFKSLLFYLCRLDEQPAHIECNISSSGFDNKLYSMQKKGNVFGLSLSNTLLLLLLVDGWWPCRHDISSWLFQAV